MLKSINYLTVALAAILLSSASGAHAMSKTSTTKTEATEATKLARLQVLFQQGFSKLQNKDYEGAETEFNFFIRDADFLSLSAENKFPIYCLLAQLQSLRGEDEKAYANLIEASILAPEARDYRYWHLLWNVSARLKKYDVAIDTMTTLAATSPKEMGHSLPDIFQTLHDAESLPDGQARREKALTMLLSANYEPELFSSAEGLWFSLFEIKVSKGDTAGAREIAKTFKLPGTYLNLRIDKRYRAYTEADSMRFNLKTLISQRVDDSRAKAKANPRKVAGVVALALDLIEDNHLTEALTLTDEAIARASAAPADKPAYDDMDEQWQWLLNTRTRILEKLGRDAESEASQIKSRDESLAKNQDVVSQRINLGDFYYERGRPQEALAQVKDIAQADSSPYGLMAAEEVRACAYAQLSDQINLSKSLDYIRAHAADGYGPAQLSLLCADDLDALAAITIARLDDPLQRNATLRLWQKYRPDAYPTTFDTQINQKAAAFVARPDVKAAIERNGYIDTYDMPRPSN
jgi:hypothetical protein